MRTSQDAGDVTQLLLAWRDGDASALDRVMPLVYDELRIIASRQLGRESGGHTLQTTALVHEAYLAPGQKFDLCSLFDTGGSCLPFGYPGGRCEPEQHEIDEQRGEHDVHSYGERCRGGWKVHIHRPKDGEFPLGRPRRESGHAG